MDPQTVDQAVFQYNLISNVTSIAALVASVFATIKATRRNPPLSEQVLEKFATKEDLAALKREELAAIRTEMTNLRTEINQQLRSGDKCFKDLERVIGQLEGALKLCPYLCGRMVAGTKGGAG